ncbi:cytochrome c553 [Angulomicrobium tetraedrale]|uniref:Cytochrome c553 n=1 Tax=Ancylobacter tetraedralis TaxID=217068 RepID=A0A839Z6Y1_9HYPH|nr:cytochrome c [Ancylobacter tetraedralis]MBB3769755.1 cytochrome c553 [Ancylobacter tetraedralis]
MRVVFCVPLLAASVMLCAPAMAQDAKAGRVKASAQCAVCHGSNGMSQLPTAPNLAGQVDIYLAKALEDFRAGRRENEMMSVVAKGLSDADIANLAAWYASIPITVGTPP